MASLPKLRTTLFGLSLLALLAPSAARADCPLGSGIEFPFLSDSEFQCQRTIFLATDAYFSTFLNARQECFNKELDGEVEPFLLRCLSPITVDQPGTTGDEQTDIRLRAAEAELTRRILTHCTNVSLETIGMPGFCKDTSPTTPFDAFDMVRCLLTRSSQLGLFLLDVEHPPFRDRMASNEVYCQKELASLSAQMTKGEFDSRGRCLVAQINRDLDLPPKIDCRREVDPQDPQVNRGFTDETIVEAHNHILRTIPNSCPAINFNNLGFPWRCEFPVNNSIFPLPALTECMFDYHHHDIFRFIDLIFPCSSKCGNGFLNVEEECDDGNTGYTGGDFCRGDCSRVACGDTNDDGRVNIVDALYALRAAVGLEQCTLLVCDVNSDLQITVSDALRLLQYSVGLPVLLNCPDLSVTCGNGFLEAKETCDDGDSAYNKGEYCNSACLLVSCGDTNADGRVSILDAQYILNASVGNVTCDLSVCDITGNGVVNSTDALRALQFAVGLSTNFNCPAPPPTPPAPPIE